MFNQYFLTGSGFLPAGVLAVFLAILPLLIVWSLVWKGWALWTAARAGSKVWFVILLIVNTLGILEILYIFWFSKMNNKNNAATPTAAPKL